MLQWGHGDEAVEETSRSVCRRHAKRFNGATAMKPWKRLDVPWSPCAGDSFNGATAMKPWKRLTHVARHGERRCVLQWGHGDEAVEELRDVDRCVAQMPASMGPRR